MTQAGALASNSRCSHEITSHTHMRRTPMRSCRTEVSVSADDQSSQAFCVYQLNSHHFRPSQFMHMQNSVKKRHNEPLPTNKRIASHTLNHRHGQQSNNPTIAVPIRSIAKVKLHSPKYKIQDEKHDIPTVLDPRYRILVPPSAINDIKYQDQASTTQLHQFGSWRGLSTLQEHPRPPSAVNVLRCAAVTASGIAVNFGFISDLLLSLYRD